MDIYLDRRAVRQIRLSAQEAIEQGDTEALREDILDAFAEEQVEEIERRLDSADCFEFLTDILDEWSGDDVLVAHIRDYYNYGDVLRYQNEVLGKVELNKDLDGYHDDYYITSLIMNDSPDHVRLPQRKDVGLDHINSLYIVEEEALEIGRKIAQFRADVTVAAIEELRAGR